ncbi:MAG: hypothetical protein NC489_07890 [Ruminococcus flavefaciens]|nr:hypothetical protein [Ruminococcus flavefaciens]
MRLIDAEALWVDIVNNSMCLDDCCHRAQGEKKGVLSLIDEAPTIEAEHITIGKWLDCVQCSCCRETYDKEIFRMYGKISYCPNCGARMDGGDEK